MIARRTILRSIPAALVAAIIPARWTRRAEAVYPYAVFDEVGPELIYVPPAGPFTITSNQRLSWSDNRWRIGPVTITYGDGRTETWHDVEMVVE